jgi:hypothetical protein
LFRGFVHDCFRNKPFLPSDLPKPNPAKAMSRAAFAVARNALINKGQGAVALAGERWPHDKEAIALTRAATSPASTSSSTWAGFLSPTFVSDFLGSLTGESAAARLIAAGTRLSLDGTYSVTVPHRSANLPNVDAQWVAELGVWPVRQVALAASTLGPTRKLITGAVVSRELADYANGEEIVGRLLIEDIGATLDASMFSATAASSSRPAGLLNGITALTATTGGGEAAIRGDLAKLAVVATATGASDLVFIASPSYAARAALYPNVVGDNLRVWPSVAVADGTIIAIAPGAFVSGFGAVPRIDAARHATLHLDDASPLAISTAGTPNTVAAPVSSMFQSDTIALRVILDAAWTLRATGAVAWLQSASW